MKTTLDKAIDAARVVARLNGTRMKSSATARKLFNLKKLLEPNFEFYADEEKKLVNELGGTIEGDGAILFPNQQEGLKKLADGRKELLASECEIPIDTPIIFHDSEGIQLSGDDIAALDGLADFKE